MQAFSCAYFEMVGLRGFEPPMLIERVGYGHGGQANRPNRPILAESRGIGPPSLAGATGFRPVRLTIDGTLQTLCITKLILLYAFAFAYRRLYAWR